MKKEKKKIRESKRVTEREITRERCKEQEIQGRRNVYPPFRPGFCQSIDVVQDPGEEKRDKKEKAEARIGRGLAIIRSITCCYGNGRGGGEGGLFATIT